MIADGGGFFAPGLREPRMSASAALIASPVAVLPAARTWLTFARTAAWFVVGLESTCAVWLNAIAPTRILSGTESRKVLAARRAASSRLGGTSVAVIEPERSVT